MSYATNHSTDQRKGGARLASATWAWIGAICTFGYLLPWAIAAQRGARNSAQVFWLNLLLGWTFVGWVVALVMALRVHQVTTMVMHQGPQGLQAQGLPTQGYPQQGYPQQGVPPHASQGRF